MFIFLSLEADWGPTTSIWHAVGVKNVWGILKGTVATAVSGRQRLLDSYCCLFLPMRSS